MRGWSPAERSPLTERTDLLAAFSPFSIFGVRSAGISVKSTQETTPYVMAPKTRSKSRHEARSEISKVWKNEENVDSCPECGSENCSIVHKIEEYTIRCRDCDNERRISYRDAL